MNRKLSLAVPLVLVSLASPALFAQSGPAARIPASYSQTANPLIQPWNVREQFEGPNTADFFNSINNPASPNASLMANPQIAVGPDEMLLVANSQIWRLPNGNAPGVIPTGLYPGSVLIGGQSFGAQRVSFDNWIGAKALADLCPTGNTDPSGTIDTGNTRSSVTCQIDNATTTYDQLHGRFLVLFTVVDTGMTFDVNSQSYRLTRPRKASWVLLVSRFAVLLDQACFQGTSPAAACPAPPIPGSGSNAAGTFAFITPTAPTGSNTGGINTAIWAIYYGNSLNGLGSDGFGSNKSATGAWVGDVGLGNINSLPGIAASPARFDCRPQAVASSGKVGILQGIPLTSCYMPTGARIGVDNDTITIVSPVINANINGADMGSVYNPINIVNPNFSLPAFAGNRVRVIKKRALYNFAALTAGNQWDGSPATAAAGDYYDLYTSPFNNGAPLNLAIPPVPYTVVLNPINCFPGQRPDLADDFSGVDFRCFLTPVFYEPAHLRGRAQASFSNLQISTAGQNSQTYLVGAVSSEAPQTFIYVQGIQHVYPAAATPPANAYGPLPFYPVLQTQSQPFPEQRGLPTPLRLPSANVNPGLVRQANYRGAGDTPGAGAQSPLLYVGDARPHNVIFREGYLYDARVVAPTPTEGVFPQAPASLSTTTKYEVIQKSCSTDACPTNVTQTQNGTLTSGSTAVTTATAGLQVGEAVSGNGIAAGTTVASINATGIVISQAALVSGVQSLTFTISNSGTPRLVYQQMWQNTNAFAPMFDVPANVVTFGVGTPYNALNFLEKLFVATTVPPLTGPADTGYNTAPAGTPTALLGDFGSGDPRTRQLFGSTGIAPIQLPAGSNCYSSSLSPGGPISGGVNNPISYASLFDTRCGTDVADSNPQVRDPYTGRTLAQTAFTIRGGEAIDPNDGSLWNFGAYPQKRDASVSALTHWGTFGANYKMSFPTTDVYGNSTVLFSDIAGAPEYGFIQIAINNGMAPSLVNAQGLPVAPPNSTPIPFAGLNSTLYGSGAGAQPVPAGVRAPGVAPPPGVFGLDDVVTRREMAYWIVKSTMDEIAITSFLTNSRSLNGVTGMGASASSFIDVPNTDPGWRYVEVMARKGYTSGCFAGVTRAYCPDYISTRRDLAAFMIRAKFGNVFASTLSGCAFSMSNGTTNPTNTLFPPAITTSCNAADSGDNFGLFVTGLPYFTDNPTETGNFWYPFVQKMRELRITNGTFLGPASDGRNGSYSIGANALPPYGDPGNLTRRQVVTFMVRGFFL